jgi:molybdate transport system substrate-binding protein
MSTPHPELAAGAWRRAAPRVAAIALVLAGTAGLASGQELTLSVAASMKEAVEELGRHFQQTHPGVRIDYNFGASGDLEKQIEAGAPIDLFISAATRQMDELERRGLVDAVTRREFARNVLVVAKPSDATQALAGAADLAASRVERIAIGNPKTVPAGQYAAESLRALGLWERLKDKLVFAENVRQVLDYVARGEVDAGVVYATDVRVRADRVAVAFRLPPSSYSPIAYPVAVVSGSRHAALARALIDLLVGPEGQTVLSGLGFEPPGGARR